MHFAERLFETRIISASILSKKRLNKHEVFTLTAKGLRLQENTIEINSDLVLRESETRKTFSPQKVEAGS